METNTPIGATPYEEFLSERVAAMANEAVPGAKKLPVGRDQPLCIIQNEWLKEECIMARSIGILSLI